MNKPITLTDDQRTALNALSHCTGRSNGDLCAHFAPLQRITGWDRQKVRRIVRQLKRKGLAEFCSPLWSDDGRPAGAGYCITEQGEKEHSNE
jgi:hypothetical protein